MILVCAVMKISEVECRWPGWRIWEDFSLIPGRHALCSDYAADGCELLYPGAALICNICAMCSCHFLSTPGPNQSRFDILLYLDISWYTVSWSSWPQVNEHSIVEAQGSEVAAPSDTSRAARCGWWANSAWCQVAGAVPESRTMALLREARSAQSTDQVPCWGR